MTQLPMSPPRSPQQSRSHLARKHRACRPGVLRVAGPHDDSAPRVPPGRSHILRALTVAANPSSLLCPVSRSLLGGRGVPIDGPPLRSRKVLRVCFPILNDNVPDRALPWALGHSHGTTVGTAPGVHPPTVGATLCRGDVESTAPLALSHPYFWVAVGYQRGPSSTLQIARLEGSSLLPPWHWIPHPVVTFSFSQGAPCSR